MARIDKTICSEDLSNETAFDSVNKFHDTLEATKVTADNGEHSELVFGHVKNTTIRPVCPNG